MPRPIPAGSTTQRKHLSTNTPSSASLHTPTHPSALHFRACPTPPPIPDLTRTSRARPLNPAALAFVPFGVVLVRVRVPGTAPTRHTDANPFVDPGRAGGWNEIPPQTETSSSSIMNFFQHTPESCGALHNPCGGAPHKHKESISHFSTNTP